MAPAEQCLGPLHLGALRNTITTTNSSLECLCSVWVPVPVHPLLCERSCRCVGCRKLVIEWDMSQKFNRYSRQLPFLAPDVSCWYGHCTCHLSAINFSRGFSCLPLGAVVDTAEKTAAHLTQLLAHIISTLTGISPFSKQMHFYLREKVTLMGCFIYICICVLPQLYYHEWI